MSSFRPLLGVLSALALSSLVLVSARPPTIYDISALQSPVDVDRVFALIANNTASTGEYARRRAPHPIPTEADPNGPIAQTQYGAVQGYTTSNVNIWRGIPYAAPPVGAFRLKSPQPALPWTGVRNTFAQGNICPQLHITDALFFGDEDCLYANVYVPTTASPTNLLPVFVWIYGGAYVLGDSDEFGLYDGLNIAAGRQHVVVSFNYRLGPLGFMANDALRAESPEGLAGNQALQDQVAALQWVKNNIQAFGGDPNRVTIGGESAGAFSVCWHLASPLSAGLFSAAILESGTCDSANFFSSYELNSNWTNTYIQMVGCDPDSPTALECLRELPTGKIMGDIIEKTGDVREDARRMHEAHAAVAKTSQWGYKPKLFPLMAWGPTIDGVALPDVPLNVINSGNYNKVNAIMGTNNNEGTIFVPLMPLIIPGVHFPVQAGDLAIAMDYLFSNNQTVTDGVEAQYPLAGFDSPEDQFNQILRDFMFVCPSRRALKAMTAQGASTFLYHWEYKGDWIEDWLLGDYHSCELEFVWDNQWPPIVHAFSASDAAMADSVDTYWSNMVFFNNPNGNETRSRTGTLGAQEYWAPYDPVDLSDMILAVPTRVEQDYMESICAFWDSVDDINTNPPTKEATTSKPKIVDAPTKRVVKKQPKIILSEL